MKTFTQKLGPLPVWAWGLIGAVLIVIAYLIYRSRSSSTTSKTSTSGTTIAPGSLGTVTSAIAGPMGPPGANAPEPTGPASASAPWYAVLRPANPQGSGFFNPQHPGVDVHATPDGSTPVIQYLPFSSTVSIVGGPATGKAWNGQVEDFWQVALPNGGTGWIPKWNIAAVVPEPYPSASTASSGGSLQSSPQTALSSSGISQQAAEATAPSYQVSG